MLDKKQVLTYKSLTNLLSPSTLSAIFCVVVSLAISISAIFINRFKPTILSLSNSDFNKGISITNSRLNGTITGNDLIKDVAPVFLSLVVAAVIYLLAYDIYQAIELYKKHGSRTKTLLKKIAINFILRLIVLAVWLPYLNLFFRLTIPYCVRMALLITSASNVLVIASDIILAVVIASTATHINVILCRLFFLKPRLFEL
jgi:hypothetical protein